MFRELVASRLAAFKDKVLENETFNAALDKTLEMASILLQKSESIVVTWKGKEYTVQDLVAKFEELKAKYQDLYNRVYSDEVDIKKFLAQLSEKDRDFLANLSLKCGLSDNGLLLCILEDFCRKYPKLSIRRKSSLVRGFRGPEEGW